MRLRSVRMPEDQRATMLHLITTSRYRTSCLIPASAFPEPTMMATTKHQTTLKAQEGSLLVEGTGEDPFSATNFTKSAQDGNLVLRF